MHDRPFHGADQLVHRQSFGQILGDPPLLGLPSQRVRLKRGQNHDGGEGVDPVDLPEDLDPVEARHANVEEGQARPSFGEQAKRLFAV